MAGKSAEVRAEAQVRVGAEAVGGHVVDLHADAPLVQLGVDAGPVGHLDGEQVVGVAVAGGCGRAAGRPGDAGQSRWR